jgi:hypothetical protein
MIGTKKPVGHPTTSPEVYGTHIVSTGTEEAGTSCHIGSLGISFKSVKEDQHLVCGCFRPTPVEVQKIPVRKRDSFPELLRAFHLSQKGRVDRGQVSISEKHLRPVGRSEQGHQ